MCAVERSHQLFSITLVLPFIAVVLGLLYYNFYPARYHTPSIDLKAGSKP
jgi:UDP-N-acetylmuramyl pentapeptide phosphotransferase/UDP-N-acetylglucosamine-1-phosphate transferase